jgi:hypothetical protein
MKKLTIVRALMLFVAISSTATAAIYSTPANLSWPEMRNYAFKPSDTIYSGSAELDPRHWEDGSGGFSRFLQEIRNAILSTGGAPPSPSRNNGTPANSGDNQQFQDTNYEATVPIKVGNGERADDTAEIHIGASVKEILDEVPPAGTVFAEQPGNNSERSQSRGRIVSIGALGGGSTRGGSGFHTCGFLSTGGAGGFSGFGFDLRQLTFPPLLDDGLTIGNGQSEEENLKSLKALRRIVLDLVFNPFVYFIGLAFTVFMFMSRFRMFMSRFRR